MGQKRELASMSWIKAFQKKKENKKLEPISETTPVCATIDLKKQKKTYYYEIVKCSRKK